MLYHSIGKYISENTRNGQWGTNAVEQISRQLSVELPGLRGCSSRNLKLMRQFYEAWNVLTNPAATAAILPSDNSATTAAESEKQDALTINTLHLLNRPVPTTDMTWNDFFLKVLRITRRSYLKRQPSKKGHFIFMLRLLTIGTNTL